MNAPSRFSWLQRIAALALLVSMLGSVGFAVGYATGVSAQFQGLALAIALGGLAVAVVIWGKFLVRQERVIDLREPTSSSWERNDATHALEAGTEQIGRRHLLSRLLGSAFAVFGIAALFTIRSLGQNPYPQLFRTKWTPGARLVRENGQPIHREDLVADEIVTVFPEGFVGAADSQTVLLRLAPGILQPASDRADWSPSDYVAYSKVCTHAGCPVGLYRSAEHQLLCPCHQSMFDVLDRAKPIAGPATRPLPQLPLRIAADGYLRAQSDFHEPIGPGFWERGA